MAMRLYDTAQRKVVDLDLANTIGMYVCGITPYDTTHLGHAATYLTYDVIIRRLRSLGIKVELVRNYTDVDDSILSKAAELGEHYLSLAEREMAQFTDDITALDVLRPAHEPRATQSIATMIEMIERLTTAGHTYSVGGVTYFDVKTFDGFGKLSGLGEAAMVDLARKRGGTPDNPNLRNQLDFVLWQPSAPGEPEWDSPFGMGRPGWHIECSAMSSATLGHTVDIHGGGGDLVFPHHECEIAQSEPLTGAPLARYWVHTGLVGYQGETMSKSLGNLVSVADLRQGVDPRAIRLALLRHHYREDWEWFDGEELAAQHDLEVLVAAAGFGTGNNTGKADAHNTGSSTNSTGSSTNSTGSSAHSTGLVADVGAALDDDLNTPAAHRMLLAAANSLSTKSPKLGPAGSSGLTSSAYSTQSRSELVAAAELCGIILNRPV